MSIDEEMKARWAAMTPDQRSRIEAHMQRYQDACHAMQSGVAMDLARGSQSGSPKHLRAGVNSAMVEHSALVHLLISKGILSEEEFYKSLADMMEIEVKRYENQLSTGTTKVKLV